MTQLKGKKVFITGATAGIGKETALLFAEKGADLILTARRKTILADMKKDIENRFKVKVFASRLDVSDKSSCKACIDGLPDHFRKIDILVNNAGMAKGLDKLHEGNLDNFDTVIDINIKGVLYMTRLIVPLMLEQGDGHIINLGSTAGHEAYAGGNVYCATKHAVRALNDGLRIDLIDTPLRVTEISPGAVETDFSKVRFDGDMERAANVYKGYTPLNGRDIAELIVFAASRPAHVQISELIVMPTAQATGSMIFKK